MLAQFNIDPIYISRLYEESRTHLRQWSHMLETELPLKLHEVLWHMADKTKMDEFREVIRISDKNWAFNDIQRMVKQGAGWEVPGCNHPAKGWGLERAGLEIQGLEEVLTYRGKEFVPPSKLQEVLASIHIDHEGTTIGQLKAQQKWFWPHMEDHIREAMDISEDCKDKPKSRDTPMEEIR